MLVIPAIGSTGDAINERQLALALSRYCKIHIYTLVPLLGIFQLKKQLKKIQIPLQSIFFIIGFPLAINLLSQLIISFTLALLARLRRYDILYIRGGILSFYPAMLKKNYRIVTKLAALEEDEIKYYVIGKYKIKLSKVDFSIFKFFLNSIWRYVAYKTDILATPSPLLLAKFCERRLVSCNKSVVFAPAGVFFDKIIEKYNRTTSSNDVYNIGFIGLFEYWQGIENIIKAAHLLEKKGFPIKLILVGDGPMRDSIVTLCKEFRVNCIITGFVSHDEALKIMSKFDVLVLPSLKTSTTDSNVPIKVIEAWALGIPVVVTRHNIFDVIGARNLENVVFCEPNPVDVAKKIELVLSSSVLRERLALNGRSLAKMFDYNKTAKRIFNAASRRLYTS
ncbi:glycosyltransferase family 4 protein [Pyrobaculum sp.]|uniref:glycosyltransferase family 4 protein n=1 Tax=Pyrobaculum sp. TaxID=2004705 RepID=UPI00315E247B